MQVYASSKLCNSLFTAELHRRLEAQKRHVDCLCVSPGMVDTGLWRDYPLWYLPPPMSSFAIECVLLL